jgi:predicted nucleic acid-binding protein
VSVKRVVVDTNVVISALTAGGTPQKIIQAWITGEFLAFIKPDKRRRALLGTLFNQALMVLPQPISEIVFPDENDHFLLELAATAQATIIVTGDKEMLKAMLSA